MVNHNRTLKGDSRKIDKLIDFELNDLEFATNYREQEKRLDIAIAFNKVRVTAGTRKELAKQAHTTSKMIAEIECGDEVSEQDYMQVSHALDKYVNTDWRTIIHELRQK